MPSSTENAELIVIMGVTGSGKSYFVNKLAGRTVVTEGDSLKSCTEFAQAIPTTIGKHKVLLIDTPGFDDSARSDTEILTEISKWLAYQYESGLSLKGVIYLHRITDLRYNGASVKTLNICQKICGKLALKNVLLVTTRWHEIDESLGAQRELELRNSFWKYMLGFESTMIRFHGDHDSAVTIVSQLLNKSTIVLEIQRELVDEGKTLNETAAGAMVNNNIEELKAKYQEELASLDKLRRDLIEGDREMMRQIQEDWEKEKIKLQQASAQQVSLQRPIAQEVRVDVARQKKKKQGIIGKVLPFLPAALSMIGMFVGLPPGFFESITGWFSESDIGTSFADLFGSC